MRKIATDLPEVWILEPDIFKDDRGFFLESFQAERYAELGMEGPFVQDNHSRSRRHTLRGLHYQLHHPQAKLCRVVQGEVYDVAVDIRRGSPCFGKWTAVVLSGENHRQLYIPRGFAHGFLVLSESADFLYKCDEVYHAGDDRGVLWSDPGLGIDWPCTNPVLSAKDQHYPPLGEIEAHHLPVLKSV